MSAGFWLSDRAWAAIEPLLPMNQPGARRVDDRRVISGIIHVLRVGCRWEDCPPAYGPATTIYNRFNRWSHRGLWGRIFATLATQAELPDDLSIDSSAVRAHRSAHGGKGGRKFRPSGGRWLSLSAPATTPTSRKPRHSWTNAPLPPAFWPTRAMTPTACATVSQRPKPKRSSPQPDRGKRQSLTIWKPTATATGSSAHSAASRTGGGSLPATTSWPETSLQPSLSQLSSSGGLD